MSTQRRERLAGRLPPAPAATRDMHNDMHDELTGRPDDPMLRRQPAPRAVVKRLVIEPALGAVHLAIAEASGGARVPDYVQPGRFP